MRAGAAQQDLSLFQPGFALGIFLSLRRTFRQRRPDDGAAICWVRSGAHGHGQLLGPERAAGHVSRAGHSAALSCHSGERRRHAGLQHRRQLPPDAADGADRIAVCARCVPRAQLGRILLASFCSGDAGHRDVRLAGPDRRQRHQHHAGNPGHQPDPVVRLHVSFRRHASAADAAGWLSRRRACFCRPPIWSPAWSGDLSCRVAC